MVSLHLFTKPVAAYLSKRVDEIRVTFKQVEVLGFKTEYLSTPLPFWLCCLRGSRLHGELELGSGENDSCSLLMADTWVNSNVLSAPRDEEEGST